MNDDYLWNRSGTPDPEVERLERLLGRYGHRPPVTRPRRRRRARVWLAVAAALIVAIATALALRFHWPVGEPWQVVALSGPATIDHHAVRSDDSLSVGQTLRTGASSRAIVRVARVGELEVLPSSELALVATSRGEHRVELRRGAVSARVWAPPFTFAVRTPAGVAYDLGCAFVLRYESGRGLLHVTSGWVEFEGERRRAAVPAGAVVELRPGIGPGTPYRANASPELRAAVRALDRGDATLGRLLAATGRRDAVTLIHLLEHAPARDRAAVFDRLAAIYPPPPGITRAGVIAGDRRMIELWRDSLGFRGAKKWWLQWRDALPR